MLVSLLSERLVRTLQQYLNSTTQLTALTDTLVWLCALLHMYLHTTIAALSLQVQQCADSVIVLQTEAVQLAGITAQAVRAQTTCESEKTTLEAQFQAQAKQHEQVSVLHKQHTLQ
jgi:hypothetical protein